MTQGEDRVGQGEGGTSLLSTYSFRETLHRIHITVSRHAHDP